MGQKGRLKEETDAVVLVQARSDSGWTRVISKTWRVRIGSGHVEGRVDAV